MELRLSNAPVLQLLCYDRGSALKRAYRYVLDGFEEWSTGCASLVLVNSSEFYRAILLLLLCHNADVS